MSLDLSIGGCDKCGSDEESFNYTYNVAPMWEKATGQDRMIDIKGLTGEQSLPILQKGLDELEKNKIIYEAMNPPNGWGSRKGFCRFLRDLIKTAQEYPHATWDVSR